MSAQPLNTCLPSFEPPLNASNSRVDDVQTEPESTAARVTLSCPEHGRYETWRSATSSAGLNDCPRCLSEQMAERNKVGRDKATQRARQDKLNRLIGDSNIPRRFASKSLDDYSATQPSQALAKTICRAYADSWEDQIGKGGSLVLTGSPGTGKTHLACAIGNIVMRDHLATVAFGSVSSITRTVRATYGRNATKTESQVLADLMLPDLMIIDEVGASNGSDHELGLLFEIINKRYENLRPMIVISNLNTDDLKKFLGHRAMDRFAECGNVIAFDWASHRGAAGVA